MGDLYKRERIFVNDLLRWTEIELQMVEAQISPFVSNEEAVKEMFKSMRNVEIGSLRTDDAGKSLLDVYISNEEVALGQLQLGNGINLFPIIQGVVSMPTEAGVANFVSGVVVEAQYCKAVVAIDDPILAFDLLAYKWAMVVVPRKETLSHVIRVLEDMSEILSDYGPYRVTRQWLGSARLIPLLISPHRSQRDRFWFDNKLRLDMISFRNPKLNLKQKKAVLLALTAHQAAVIYGPPGTGKSITLVETIQQLLRRKKRILVCAPSKFSVDSLLEKTIEMSPNCLAIGQPGNLINPKLRDFYLGHKLKNQNQDAREALIKEKNQLLDSLTSCKTLPEKEELDHGLARIQAQIQKAEKELGDALISSSPVVFSTLRSCGGSSLEGHAFDVVIIDDAAHALEPDCWLAISHASKVILAGDTQQLAPSVKSNEEGLRNTLFKRLVEGFPPLSHRLTEQFRMHFDIAQLLSRLLYGVHFISNQLVKNHLLSDLKGVKKIPATSAPVVFLNTNQSDMPEHIRGPLMFNPGEATLLAQHLQTLVSAGVDQTKIAVTSPYSGQVKFLREILAEEFPNVRVSLIEGLQGGEWEAVIISLVRSNPSNLVGLLNDHRRLNFALSRARRHVCIIGNGDTISDYYMESLPSPPPHHDFLFKLGSYLMDYAS